ncbi:MAG: hypothetical protein Kow0069_06870 [Promethearchaeota archaeon]
MRATRAKWACLQKFSPLRIPGMTKSDKTPRQRRKAACAREPLDRRCSSKDRTDSRKAPDVVPNARRTQLGSTCRERNED